MDGLLAVFEAHRRELEPIYGKFPPYPSFDQIIRVEYERWLTTDAESKKKLEALLKKCVLCVLRASCQQTAV